MAADHAVSRKGFLALLKFAQMLDEYHWAGGGTSQLCHLYHYVTNDWQTQAPTHGSSDQRM